jgi:N-acetylglucosamine-6-phosphate deacetylase
VLTPLQEWALGWVRVEGARITDCGEGDPPSALTAGTVEVHGGPEHVVAPGFCDLQVNGIAGVDAADGAEAMAAIADRLPRHGVTAFCPTVITGPLHLLVQAPAAARRAAQAGGTRAKILGIHQEGPFLSPHRPGAHDPSQLRPPDASALDWVVQAGPRVVTLAPELPGAVPAIRQLAAAGITVSAGHSDATAEEAQAGFDAGIRMATHLFNAMSPLRHRAPGLPGAALADDRVTAGLIADGLHVDPVVLTVVARAKGAGRIALTSDIVAAAGAPAGRYRLGTQEVSSDGDRVTLDDGTMAGSASPLDDLVRTMATLPGVGLRAAVEMASATPARLLGCAAGRIARGAPADLVLLDRARRVVLTVIEGEVAYRA